MSMMQVIAKEENGLCDKMTLNNGRLHTITLHPSLPEARSFISDYILEKINTAQK